MSKEATFIQNGDAIDISAGSAAISAGAVIISGEIVGVAKLDIPANTVGAVALVGVFDVAKASADAFTVGAPVYFNAMWTPLPAASSSTTTARPAWCPITPSYGRSLPTPGHVCGTWRPHTGARPPEVRPYRPPGTRGCCGKKGRTEKHGQTARTDAPQHTPGVFAP